jgi:hypothetical protein
LETHTPNNLSVSDAKLVFWEEVIFKQRKVRRNPKKGFIEVDKKWKFGGLS